MRVKLARMLAAWLAAVTVVSGLGVLGASAAHADSVSEEGQFLALTNQLRSSLGLQTLTPQAQLTSVARQWSSQMAAAGTISHNPALTSQAPSDWTQLGENVGMGGTVDSIQTAFINSPHHYENLVNGAYDFVGIGVADANGTIFVTVDFMAAPAGAGGGAPAIAPHVSAPRPAPAPRPEVPAAPRAVAPAQVASPAAPAPAATPVTTLPAPVAPTPVSVHSPALDQVLSQLRSVDNAA
ncbi:MAG: CAP domain-containing protein [Acidimicrobiia bacterium]|nr:CAP domain-containing protein [Acidimicrobiia bacterium]